MQNCIFCQIASKEKSAQIEYEDKDIVVFHDINPKAKVHLLIIPKKHLAYLDEVKDTDTELLGKMILAANKIAKRFKLNNGYRLVINNRAHAGQIVDHLHLHLLGGDQLGPMA